MSVFDLLFILVVLCTVTALAACIVNLIRGRRGGALRGLRTLGVALGVYFTVVAVVAVSAPQKVIGMGEDRCFDEMCFAVTSVKVVPAIGQSSHRVNARGNFYVVDIRVSDHGHRRAQSEAGVGVSLFWQGRLSIQEHVAHKARQA